MQPFDIAPFALPGAPAGEIWFEEARDVRAVRVRYRQRAALRIRLSYWRRRWPAIRVEGRRDLEDPAAWGWTATDDWFNGAWQPARTTCLVRQRTATVSFRPLRLEHLAEAPAGYDVVFRRTMGLRFDVPDWRAVRNVEVYTCSPPAASRLRVELDAGRRTRGGRLRLTGYNAWVQDRAGDGECVRELGRGTPRAFAVDVRHMQPAHRYAGDDALVEFHLDHDCFTVSLPALAAQGPVWCAEEGVFVTRADDPTTFADYRRQHRRARTVCQTIARAGEHSLAAAMHGQPCPHPVAYSLGCTHSPQRFWLEPNGDLVLHRDNLTRLDRPGRCVARFLAAGAARLFFGLERWVATGRGVGPGPVPVHRLSVQRHDLQLEQRALCVPLRRRLDELDELGFDDTTVALLAFRVTNAGAAPAELALPVHYSEDSGRQRHGLAIFAGQTDGLVPRSPLVPLLAQGDALSSRYGDRLVLRALVAGDVGVTGAAADTTAGSAPEAGPGPVRAGDPSPLTGPLAVWIRAWLGPGATCEFVLKVPFVALEGEEELAALRALDFASCQAQVAAYWRRQSGRGAQLEAPVPQLERLHANHLMHVQITDIAMPEPGGLLNTSVGTSTYGNFSNEACMIVQELEQRGLAAEARRRLDLWVRYQGSVPQPGNFSDYSGMYFGAGGFEQGSYNQHHGWVLWALAEHYLINRDEPWFAAVADSVVAGADWIFRQRRLTLDSPARSRGWERGFLPAGSLEDVTEFHYWLSTNCLTWRGADAAARALAAAGHPAAARVRQEADAYRDDLRRGLETMRQHTPLVRLRDGRWVPHYPSRLYCRGRDQGWIRQVLEGAVYLLISGLYDCRSRQASWILDDYQDNLYHDPPYGYLLRDQQITLAARGGFSIQPCLLAGLLPHLDRDEPELFLWMLFNAFAAVYREQIGGMIEHPLPELGFANSVTFKTSDEANAAMWLRYAYVYWTDALLHFGRALPRSWFDQETSYGLTGVRTHYGPVSVRYEPEPARRRVTAHVELGSLRTRPATVLVRFRTPDRQPLRRVLVDGAVRPAGPGEDVEVSGNQGTVHVEAEY